MNPSIEVKPAWLVNHTGITKGFGFTITYLDFGSNRDRFFTSSDTAPFVWKKIQFGEDMEFSLSDAIHRQKEVAKSHLKMYKDRQREAAEKIEQLEQIIKQPIKHEPT